jgi:hypothetical protein
LIRVHCGPERSNSPRDTRIARGARWPASNEVDQVGIVVLVIDGSTARLEFWPVGVACRGHAASVDTDVRYRPGVPYPSWPRGSGDGGGATARRTSRADELGKLGKRFTAEPRISGLRPIGAARLRRHRRDRSRYNTAMLARARGNVPVGLVRIGDRMRS